MRTTAIIAIIALATVSCRKTKVQETTISISDTISQTKMAPDKQCFLSVTGKDSIVFEMERKGDSVSGIFNVLPYEKDKRISTYRGILNGNSGTALGKYSAEGINYTEELHFTLSGDKVTIDFGPTEQSADGIWRYKKNQKRYEHILPKVNCKE